MAKRTKKKSKLAPRVKEVVLPKSSVLRVKAPPGVKQVAVDHEEQVVEIVTFPKAPDEKKYWWQTLLGL